MEWQKEWVKIIQPIACLLKFRVAYPEIQKEDEASNKYKYLDGTLYMQQYAPIKSTEMRLLSIKNKTHYKDKIYDRYEIESKCFYFNQVVRQQYFYNNKIIKCTSHHYDSNAEILLWKKYLEDRNIKPTEDKICKLMKLLTKCIINPEYNIIKTELKKII